MPVDDIQLDDTEISNDELLEALSNEANTDDTPINLDTTDAPELTKAERRLKAKEDWENLKRHLWECFYRPDLQALRVALSAYIAHHYYAEDPIWLFVIGPPGSGKTSIVLKSLSFLEFTQSVDDLTINTFISGFNDGRGGLLPNLRGAIYSPEAAIKGIVRGKFKQGILTFPDFTTFLQKGEETRNAIIGQLRRIYDGTFEKGVGTKDKPIKWVGKLTCLAACTPEIEHHYRMYNALGERFLTVRWKGQDGSEVARKAFKQIDREEWIGELFQNLTRELVGPINNLVTHDRIGMVISKQIEERINLLANLTAKLRTIPKRERIGSKWVITDIPESEQPTRIMKQLCQLAKGSATLSRRDTVEPYDFKLCIRVALDSIPPAKKAVIQKLPIQGCYANDLKKQTGLTDYVFDRTIEDLEAFGVLQPTEVKSEYLDEEAHKWIEFNEIAREKLESSGIRKFA